MTDSSTLKLVPSENVAESATTNNAEDDRGRKRTFTNTVTTG